MAGGDLRAVRVRITGRVQGVGYRYWTERVAGEIGLSGWVRNRRDGTVEAVFSGRPEEVAEMIERCHDGPPSAQVSAIDVTDGESEPAPGFEMRATA